MEHARMNRRRLLRMGLATTAALGAAALPGLSWTNTPGRPPGAGREEGGRDEDSRPDARDRARGRRATGASGQVIRAWNEIARAQPFGNGTRLSRILSIMHAAQHDAVNGADPRYET